MSAYFSYNSSLLKVLNLRRRPYLRSYYPHTQRSRYRPKAPRIVRIPLIVTLQPYMILWNQLRFTRRRIRGELHITSHCFDSLAHIGFTIKWILKEDDIISPVASEIRRNLVSDDNSSIFVLEGRVHRLAYQFIETEDIIVYEFEEHEGLRSDEYEQAVLFGGGLDF